jgi:microcin C transport system substrate-binding protein
MKKLPFLSLLISLLFVSGFAQDNKATSYPTKDWTKIKNPIASEDAEIGGQIVVFSGQYPKSFNYYTELGQFQSSLFSLMYDTLLNTHPTNLERMPGIVNKWSISEDKTTYTLSIDPKAKWSDGKPVTSADVAFTYDTIMNNLTGPWQTDLKKINKPEIIDEKTFKIVAKEMHWKIEGIIAGIYVLPKHAMEGQDFMKLNFEFPVVSGGYKIKEVKEGNYIDLERRTDWWARYSKINDGTNNFLTIRYKFFAEEKNAFDSFQKGEIDLFAVYMSKRWIEMATGDKYDKYQISKQRIYNFKPDGFQGFSMNMRRPLFKDKRVRLALAHLLNRERFNNELMFKQYAMTSSYFGDLYSKEHPNKNRIVDFNKEKAKKLLDEAGWKPNKDGILEKDGLLFEFNFLIQDASSNKFLDIYKDDLKDVGIILKVILKDQATWTKDIDTYNYDMTWAAFGGGLYKDPESMWDTKEIPVVSGQNLPGFSSTQVDALIEKQKTEFDIEKRNEIVRQIDAILTEEQPYILLWNNDNTRLLYWSKFGTPITILDKFGDEASAISYWWYDKEADNALKDSLKTGKSLPKKSPSVKFEEVFKGN